MAVGAASLNFNTTGVGNTGEGYATLKNNIPSNDNVAIGFQALENSTSAGNTAVGSLALDDNITGSFIRAVDRHALLASASIAGFLK